MIFKNYICFLLIHIPLSAYAEYSHFLFTTESLFKNSNVKREVNLEIFDDIKQVKKEKEKNDVVNICEEFGDPWHPCYCLGEAISCTELKTANLRPVDENFVIEIAFFENCQNMTLEKDKMFPGNEATINKLTITQSKIDKIDNNAFDSLRSLKSLFFFYSSLPWIDENILTEKFGNILFELGITRCKMTNIRLSIFKNLINLEELNLSYNKQASGTFDVVFPKSLSKLKILNLQSCNLSSFNADTFKYLRNLADLNLCSNKFTSIPSAIMFLPNLKVIDFERNELTVVKKNDFEANVKLENISFVNNYNLKFVASCAFCNLERSLKSIDFLLCDNLSYIDENAFGSISNRITPKLEMFNIKECNISVLHENLLDWKNVEKMVLFGNPFACNCSMAWLFNDLMSNNSIYENKTAHWIYGLHHKFELGCLGPPPTTPNYTYPYSIVEIFSSCEKPSSSSKLHWYFLLMFVIFIAMAFSVIYTNRRHLHILF